jgi:NTE family protein
MHVGLVLTGGGARGAYQAGALLAMAEITKAKRLPFGVVSGASAGSLSGAYLASHAGDFMGAARSLADMWSMLEPRKVFRTDNLTLLRTATEWGADLGLGGWIGTGRGHSLLDTAPLRKLVVDAVDVDAIHHRVASGELGGFAVTATSYRTGLGVTFFEGASTIVPWARATRIGVRADIGVDHVMASSAIPMFFPAVCIGDSWYADGCIRLSTPLSPAIHMGARKIVAIAVRDAAAGGEHAETTTPLAPSEHLPPYPSTADTAGLLLNALFLDALEADVERTRRINQTLSLITPEVRATRATALEHVDVLLLRPSVDPASLVLATLEHFPIAVRHLFRGLGASDTTGWDLLSYLAFEGVYTTRLMQLGYDDALAQADAIRAFMA